MATISKDSLAQFWLNTFPICDNYEYLSFSDTTIASNLLKFTSEKNEEKKIFEIIHGYIRETKTKNITKIIEDKKTSPKRRRSTKNNLINIDATRLRFTINIEVIENLDYEEEITTTIETKIEDRTIENLTSLLNETNSDIISKRFQTLIYSWFIDVSFNISNDYFSILVELMNKYSEEFLRHCFVPWIRNISTDNINLFYSNLFTQLTNLSDRCKLCSYLCENSTCAFNDNELCIISKWFDSKEFYFSNDLLNNLPEKVATSAKIYSDNLPFAKVLHKILIKCTENNEIINTEQRLILKQAITINTTILSDILMDLLD
ncbi:unnamed protein product [Adineta steineri]|uniref:Uncharacterized protein n=1 Tax=Adineta steineri TaxID=433720 RepID=A0A815K2G0_9BILA|nr:unnamed protein product [Adineta steineri]CAF1385532.1 unnamed protein product [Adineta steineri]